MCNTDYGGGGGGKNVPKIDYVICERPLITTNYPPQYLLCYTSHSSLKLHETLSRLTDYTPVLNTASKNRKSLSEKVDETGYNW